MIRNTGDDSGSRTEHDQPRVTGTTAGAEATSRMAGIRNTDDRSDDRAVTSDTPRGKHVDTTQVSSHEQRLLPAKTSAAAAFALVFGLAALFCALTAILAPAAVLFGLIGIVLGIAGLKMAKRTGVTGKGVATGGLVTAVLGLLLGGAVLAGAAVVVNDEQRLDQLQTWIEDRRADLPSAQDIREELPS